MKYKSKVVKLNMSENAPNKLRDKLDANLEKINGEIISVTQTATRKRGVYSDEYLTLVIVYKEDNDA